MKGGRRLRGWRQMPPVIHLVVHGSVGQVVMGDAAVRGGLRQAPAPEVNRFTCTAGGLAATLGGSSCPLRSCCPCSPPPAAT